MVTYCAADWHGCYWIWEQVQKYLKPDDRLIFLGDAADRGPDGWQLIKELLADSRVTYFKGNHEDLMIKAIGHYSPEHFRDDWFHWDKSMELWYWNGGESTYEAFMNDNAISPEEKIELLHKIAALPFCGVYNNTEDKIFLLSHAGCDDFDTAEKWDEEHFLWDRSHWLFANDWTGKDNEMIIHGHTPIELMLDEQKHYGKIARYSGHGAYWYGQGHKICIDTGAVWNNEAVLFNLDNYTEIILNKNS